MVGYIANLIYKDINFGKEKGKEICIKQAKMEKSEK